MASHITTIRTFFSFVYRDLYIYGKHLKDDFINYVIIYPLLGSINFGYLQSNIYFGHQSPEFSIIYLTGYLLLILLIVTFRKMIGLLFDLEEHRFIDFQMTILPARLILVARWLAVGITTFALAAPFFVVSKLVLGAKLDTAMANWWMVYTILLLSCLMCSGYHLLASCALRDNQLSSLWSRFNNPLLTLGGFWAPWYIIHAFSATLGYLMYLNPLLYVTEGLRQGLIGSSQFFSFPLALGGLITANLLFLTASFMIFKRRVDHI